MNQTARSVLLIEDTETLSLVYRQALIRAGLSVEQAFTLSQARDILGRTQPEVVLLDIQLPDGDGLDLLSHIHDTYPGLPVIVITANGSIYRAVHAMRAGAFDFLVKPFDDSRLVAAVENALTTRPPSAEAASGGGCEVEGFEGFVCKSEAMASICRMVGAIGRSMATVFITGESGTGKDVCARAIHAMSNRAGRAFVPLNCAAIPRDLLESEVFGHLKGAFTGALSDKPGAAAIADGGTLFLDEICEMDLSLQTKLLRFLQTSTIQPVGAARPKSVDVRIVCATNRDPLEEVRAGRFREDLYYRLHVVPIKMPPLRGRGEDVMEIARRSLAEFSAEEGKRFTGFDVEVERILTEHPWPGNVRQLLNVVRNIVVLHDGELVRASMLPSEMLVARAVEPAPSGSAFTGAVNGSPAHVPAAFAGGDNPLAGLVGRTLSDVEREFIEATIDHCGGSIPRAAKTLGLSPSTIYRKLESWKDARDSA